MTKDVELKEEVLQPHEVKEPATTYSTLRTYVNGNRRLIINFPGLISLAGDRGYFPGCRLVTFRAGRPPSGLNQEDVFKLKAALELKSNTLPAWPVAEEQINAFFEMYGNLSIVDWRIREGAFTCLITTQMEGEQLEDFQEAGKFMEMKMRELREAREAAKQAAQQEKADSAAQDGFDLALGRKAREHGLVDQLRRLEEENVALKKKASISEKSEKPEKKGKR